ncbi:DNA phosphorothioation-dependent restriction protein DptF [Natronomonas gomsonensis]|uniref:DNA phosphorothioation-dependent restriction protein DptF n=1 Tax=Natronomonas gomsonensis TaxID=1046043 RepID=UPI0015BCDF24|nr:DNA phosphorothioation-dependent restriction protein DptF [Natronomonas gomsonensis]
MAPDPGPEETETLYELLYACQRGQQVAIVGGHTDDDPLRNQLYIEQEEDEHVSSFFKEADTEDGQLLILTGSAGDGKSALLARGFEHTDELPQERVNMDATESRRRDGDYADRLTSFFDDVVGDVETGAGQRSALAINYGLAVDYFERRDTPEEFQPVWEALKTSQSVPIHNSGASNITVINLSHRRTYRTHPDHLGEGLVRDLLDRFDPTNEESPFTDAFEHEMERCPAGDECLLQYNIRQLTQTAVKDQIARLLAGWSVTTGSYLNPRTIIDNIASLLLPTGLHDLPGHESCPVGAAIADGHLEATESDIVWNSLFESIQSHQDASVSSLDPASYTSFSTDQKALSWGADKSELDGQLSEIPAIEFKSTTKKVRTLLRKQYMTLEAGDTVLDDPPFDQFVAGITYFGQEEDHPDLIEDVKTLLNTTKTALSSWTGRQRDDDLVEFVDGYRSPDYRFLSQWNEPNIDTDKSGKESRSLVVPGRIKLIAEPPPEMDSPVPIPLSFQTYRLMTQIRDGYTPNATDLNRSHAIRMLHSRLDDFTEKRQSVTIENRTGSRSITVKEGDLGITVESEGI